MNHETLFKCGEALACDTSYTSTPLPNHMVDVALRVDGEVPAIRLSADANEVLLWLNPQATFEDGQALTELLRRCIHGISVEIPSPGRSQELTDWHAYLVTCPCGRTFSDSGLEGLGKHASGCNYAQEDLHVGTSRGSRVYAPVVEAIHEWNSDREFTIPLLEEQFQNVDVKISSTALRSHIRWMEERGYLRCERSGRNKVYHFLKELPPLSGGVDHE